MSKKKKPVIKKQRKPVIITISYYRDEVPSDLPALKEVVRVIEQSGDLMFGTHWKLEGGRIQVSGLRSTPKQPSNQETTMEGSNATTNPTD